MLGSLRVGARLLALAVAGCAMPPASRAADKELATAVEAAAHDALEQGAERVGVAILRGDELAAVRDETAVVPLASISKQYWAVAAVQLAAEGRLDIDAPVARVLPAFPAADVRVRDLLQHTSGLGDDFAGEDDEAFTDRPAFAFPAGTFWRYSNRGSLVVRRVVERASGQAWAAVLRERIADPLGLTSTRVCAPADGPGMPAAEMERIGFVCASALDVARFERGLDRGRLLPPEWLERMHAPVTLSVGGAKIELGYGWFTRIGEVDGHRAIGHTGNFPGVSVAAFTFPEEGLTIAVLERGAPQHHVTAVALLSRLARAALGLPDPKLPTASSPPPTLLTACAGEYDLGGELLHIEARDGQLWARSAGMEAPMKLLWVGGSSFLGGPSGFDPDEPSTFHLNGNRAVAVSWGHRLMLDGIAPRLPQVPP